MRKEARVQPGGGWRRVGGWVAAVLAGLVGLAVLLGIVAAIGLRRSLPDLNGDLRVAGLDRPVTIERDAHGVPTITAVDRRDASFALGYLHAQDRFFQMDLLRRSAAGELAALFGPQALPLDRAVRVHRFRDRARQLAATIPRADQLEAYARGVNAGLAHLGARPFEYLLLRAHPEPWLPEDVLLTVFAMYLDLQSSDGDYESCIGVVHDVLPPALAAFVDARGTAWDAPLTGAAADVPPMPGPEVVDLRRELRVGRRDATDADPVDARGSNNWAVDGAHAAGGRALLAGDMHLGLGVPNIWYRASIVLGSADATRRVTGITLPGAPAIVAGSNGAVAWAFTNSEVDTSDLVVLETDAAASTYGTPEGPRAFDRRREILRVRSAAAETLVVDATIWGPVIDIDHRGRRRAFRWVAYEPNAVNLELLAMEGARSVAEGVEIAKRTAIPAQNCVLADRDGHVGWTLMGPVPRRFGWDGRTPRSWADGRCGWDGTLAPEEVPSVVDPVSGRIWSANNRLLDGEQLVRVGDGGYAFGARAQQIRDAVFAFESATPTDFLQLQLDDRALFLAPWRDVMLGALAGQTSEVHATLRRFVQDWGGRAAIGSVGYRAVREFRNVVAALVLTPLLQPCRSADTRFRDWQLRQREGALWRLVQERPPHLLPASFETWETLLVAAVDTTIAHLNGAGSDLSPHTWGEANTSRIRHPLSRAAPFLSRWLDMRPRPLPGDQHMPRVQSPSAGASQRLVVSPGREAEGFFHMPCGQSGHPLSPFYRDLHRAWEEGAPTPFLPGPKRYTLRIEPRSG